MFAPSPIKKILQFLLYLLALLTAPLHRFNSKNFSSEVSFVLVTYFGRFEHFKGIVLQLDRFYPNIHKTIFLNGRDDDDSAQEKFLAEAEKFLGQFKNLTVVSNKRFVCQSKLWNQGLIQAKTEKVIVMNDSVTILGPFLKRKMLLFPFVKINNSYSNYIISKSVVASIGWFDENFIAGASQTDGDMEARLVLSSISLTSIRSPYIYWKKFENKVTWDPKLGGVVDKKTSNYNTAHFLKKWNVSENRTRDSVYTPIISAYITGPNPGYETPNPYPEILDDWKQKYSK